MSAHYLPAIHIPNLPACLANKQRLTEYVDDWHHIGEVSHIDIINVGDVHSAFILFKCPWNNGRVSNLIRKAIVEEGVWEENIRTGFEWLPEGDAIHIRVERWTNPEIDTALDQFKSNIQYTLIGQWKEIELLKKELAEEREKNRVLQDVYNKTLFNAVNYEDLDIPAVLHIDDLSSD